MHTGHYERDKKLVSSFTGLINNAYKSDKELVISFKMKGTIRDNVRASGRPSVSNPGRAVLESLRRQKPFHLRR